MKSFKTKLAFLSFFSIISLNIYSQSINDIDFNSFSYYEIDSINYRLNGILNSGENLIIDFTESYTIDNAKFLINIELGVLPKNQERIIKLIIRLHKTLFNTEQNEYFINNHVEYEYLDSEESRFEIAAIDDYGTILQEINMGTLVLVFYREWIGD